MPVDNNAIIRRLYEEVWNRRKLEVLSELVSPSHASPRSQLFWFRNRP